MNMNQGQLKDPIVDNKDNNIEPFIPNQSPDSSMLPGSCYDPNFMQESLD